LRSTRVAFAPKAVFVTLRLAIDELILKVLQAAGHKRIFLIPAHPPPPDGGGCVSGNVYESSSKSLKSLLTEKRVLGFLRHKTTKLFIIKREKIR